jgi:hypothetical protein
VALVVAQEYQVMEGPALWVQTVPLEALVAPVVRHMLVV